MKKIIVGLVILAILLSGCGNDNKGVSDEKIEKEFPIEKQIELYEENVLNKETRDNEDFILENGITPSLTNQVVLDVDGRKYYHFTVHMLPTGIDDNSYVIVESSEGVKIVYEYFTSSRIHYNIYEGGYIQNCGSGGASSWNERLLLLGDEVETIYEYSFGNLKYEFDNTLFNNKETFEVIEALKGIGFSGEKIDGIKLDKMVVGEKTAWLVTFSYQFTEEEIAEVYEIIGNYCKVNNIDICQDKKEFAKVSNVFLLEKGISIDNIFSSDPVLGEKESFVWSLTDN